MKNLLVLIALAGGAYFYYINQAVEVNIDSYRALLNKVENEPVTSDEIKIGANLLTKAFCNDVTLQASGGGSVRACTDKYLAFKDMCEDRIFGKEKRSFTNKKEVTTLVKRFTACAGIS
ncbi:MAG: hypothetical protein HRU40_02885 [Saprospiraceae bacterium]|nr:hypothetical protein [Saprospiraceae bacterium]